MNKVSEPTIEGKYYLRLMYHTFWWGPFNSAKEVGEFCKAMDEKDPYWCYDTFTVDVVRDGKREWPGDNFRDEVKAHRR